MIDASIRVVDDYINQHNINYSFAFRLIFEDILDKSKAYRRLLALLYRIDFDKKIKCYICSTKEFKLNQDDIDKVKMLIYESSNIYISDIFAINKYDLIFI